jgi:uncharacterized membrane protein YeaQ/YmgE (transglycosylase-associated protein family)
MGIFSWFVVGLIAGWLASLVIKGKGSGLISNLIIGVVGGLLGGWLASAIFNIPDPLTGIDLKSILVAFGGSVLLLWIIRLLRK